MDRCGTSDGHLIIFDRREDIAWDDKIFRRLERCKNKEIVIWGMYGAFGLNLHVQPRSLSFFCALVRGKVLCY